LFRESATPQKKKRTTKKERDATYGGKEKRALTPQFSRKGRPGDTRHGSFVLSQTRRKVSARTKRGRPSILQGKKSLERRGTMTTPQSREKKKGTEEFWRPGREAGMVPRGLATNLSNWRRKTPRGTRRYSFRGRGGPFKIPQKVCDQDGTILAGNRCS